MLKTNTVFIVEDLQKALDNKDIPNINKFMALIFDDYDKSYVYVLIDYNSTFDIKAVDLLNFRYVHPNTSFIQLFCFEPHLVKVFCSHDKYLERVGE